MKLQVVSIARLKAEKRGCEWRAVPPPGWPKGLSTVGLAKLSCVFCYGRGWVKKPMAKTNLCGCVYRGVFNACLGQYYRTEEAAPPMRPRYRAGHGELNCCSYPKLEFQADFLNCAKRNLKPQEHELFRLYYVQRIPWKLAAVKLGVNHGQFWHLVYAVQEKLGEAAVTQQPYGLFPIDQYLSSASVELKPRRTGVVIGAIFGSGPDQNTLPAKQRVRRIPYAA